MDLKAKQKALKIKCMIQAEENSFLATCIYQALNQNLSNIIWKCNLQAKDVPKYFDMSNKWVQGYTAWCEFNYSDPQWKIDIMNQILWYNSNILIDGQVVKWKNWIDQNILFVSDLFDVNGNPKSYDYFKYEFTNVGWLNFLALIDAIPKTWKLYLKENEFGEVTTPKYKLCQVTKGLTKKIYDQLIYDNTNLLQYFQKWIQDGFDIDYPAYCKLFKRNQQMTKIVKFRDFGYRFLLHKIVTNSDLYEWGQKDSALCTFCNTVVETYQHLFYECDNIQLIIKEIE